MTLYGYARVSVREPEDKNLDLQVERLVRAGCAMGNVRAEEASGAKDDRGGLSNASGSLFIKSPTFVRSWLASVSEKVVSSTRASGLDLMARCAVRCRATTVLPVPAEPDTLAGPL